MDAPIYLLLYPAVTVSAANDEIGASAAPEKLLPCRDKYMISIMPY